MPNTVFFCEVQMQKDERLYERLFGESFLYFYRQRERFADWQAVVIYPSRSTEQSSVHPYRALLASEQVHRIYLNELGEPSQLPLGIGLLVLTTLSQDQAPQQARALIGRLDEAPPDTNPQVIINLITTIVAYRFTHMSRQEVEAMLGLPLQETRFYQEAKEEGRQEGRQEGEAALILRLLNRRVGTLSPELRARATALPLPLLKELGEALLDFEAISDLLSWLDQYPIETEQSV